MIKVVIAVKRKTGTTPEELHRYMKDVHGELVKGLTSSKKYIRKYIQSYTIQEEYERGEVPFDALAELWFDSIEDMNAAGQMPEVLEQVRPDEKRFADQLETKIFVTVENQIM